MTINLTPLPMDDIAPGETHDRSTGTAAHIFVGAAIAITSCALALFLAVQIPLPPILAALSGLAFGATAGLAHFKISQPTAPPQRKRSTKPARRAPTLDGVASSLDGAIAEGLGPYRQPSLEPLSVQPTQEPTAVAQHAPVEPSDLALALLASLNASSNAAAAIPVHETGQWHQTLAAQLPDEPNLVPVAPHADSLHTAARTTPFSAAHEAALIASSASASEAQTGRSESELERVERLVKRLADNVNQAQALRHAHAEAQTQARSAPHTLAEQHRPHAQPGPEPVQLGLFTSEADTNHQLAASINALRLANASASTPIASDQQRMPTSPLDTSEASTWTPVQRASATTPGTQTPRQQILSALNAQRMDVFLEPILDLSDQRPQHYEVSIALRTADGHAINLAEAAVDLSGTGLLPLIDQARIARAAQLARRLAERGKDGAVFTEMNGETLYDSGFKETFANPGIAVGSFPGQLVLTLPQAHVATFTTADWQTLARLRTAGFGFALIDVTTLDMDFQRLTQAGFNFARLDAETFLIGLPTEGQMVAPQDICRHLAHSGLMLIVGGILDDNQLARIFGLGVLFGQGQLFGAPRPMKSEAAPNGPRSTSPATTTAG